LSQRQRETHAVDVVGYPAMYTENVLQQPPRLARVGKQMERVVMAGVFACDINRSVRTHASFDDNMEEVQRLDRLSGSSAEDFDRIRRDTCSWPTLDFKDHERRVTGLTEPGDIYGRRAMRQLVLGPNRVAESASEVEKSRDDLAARLQRMFRHGCSLLRRRPNVQDLVPLGSVSPTARGVATTGCGCGRR
jgi:hypothetical protein